MSSPATQPEPTKTDPLIQDNPFANTSTDEIIEKLEALNARSAEIEDRQYKRGEGIMEPIGNTSPLTFYEKPLNLRPKTSFSNMGIRGHYWVG